jgi:hypothetical protein
MNFGALFLLEGFKTDLTERIVSHKTKLATVGNWTELDYVIPSNFDELLCV